MPPASCIAHPVVVPRSSDRMAREPKVTAGGTISLLAAGKLVAITWTSSKRNLIAAFPVGGRLAADASDGRARKFLLDVEDAIAERFDQDRDLADGEHATFARDVVGFLGAAHERDDLAG